MSRSVRVARWAGRYWLPAAGAVLLGSLSGARTTLMAQSAAPLRYRVITALVRQGHAVEFEPLSPIDWHEMAVRALPGRDLEHPDSAWLAANLEPLISAALLAFKGSVPARVTREFYTAIGPAGWAQLQVDSVAGEIVYELDDGAPRVRQLRYSGGLLGQPPDSAAEIAQLPFVIWTPVPETFVSTAVRLIPDSARGAFSVRMSDRFIRFTTRRGGTGAFISTHRGTSPFPDRVGAFKSAVLPAVLVFSWPEDDECGAEFQIWDVASEPRLLAARPGSCSE
ncbi:MAG: hypothetical protein ACREL4_03605 [Gemmatimonadales bacterium]